MFGGSRPRVFPGLRVPGSLRSYLRHFGDPLLPGRRGRHVGRNSHKNRLTAGIEPETRCVCACVRFLNSTTTLNKQRRSEPP